MIALAERLGARRPGDRPLRADRRRRRGPAARRRRRPRPRTRPTCSPGCRRRRSRGCASRSADLTKPEVREIAAAAGLAGRRQGREPGPLLPRRRGQGGLPRPPRRPRRPARRDRRRRGQPARGRTTATTASRSASAAGIGVGAPEPLYVLATDAASQPRHGRPAPRSSRAAPRRGPRRRPAPAGRAGRSVRLRYRSSRSLPDRTVDAGGRRRRARPARARARDPRRPRRPARPPSSATATSSSATARSPALTSRSLHPPVNSDEIRETYLSFFERHDHLRLPSASLIPAPTTPRRCSPSPGMQPFQPYFLGREQPPAPRLTLLAALLPHPRHRGGRQHRAPPDLLRDARQLLVRRLLQGARRSSWPGSSRSRASASTPSRSGSPSSSGDEELGLGPDDGGDRDLARARRPRGADRRAAALGELLAGRRRPGPCGPCSELYIDRGPDFGGPTTTAPATTTIATSSTGTSSSPPTSCRGRLAHRAAGEEHRHRPRPRADGGDPAGRRLGLRHRPAPAAGRPRRASSPAAPTAATTRRRRGRCGSSPTTRAAPSSCSATASSPRTSGRGYVLRRIMRRAIHQGRVLGLEPPYLGRFAERAIELLARRQPARRGRARHDHALGRRRGGELRPHARPRQPTCSSGSIDDDDRRRAPRGSTPRTPSSSTTPTASPTT